MASVENYFPNNLTDYGPNTEIDNKFNEFLMHKIIETSNTIWDKVSKHEDFQIDDIYSGNIGISYMFWYLSQQKVFSDQQKHDFLLKARKVISRSINVMVANRIERPHSFLLGNCGICLIAGLIFDSLKEEKFRDHYLNLFVRFCNFYATLDVDDQHRDSLLEGRSGFICAALVANHTFKAHVIPMQTLQNIGISSMKSGKYNALKLGSELPLIYEHEERQDISVCNGMSGVLLSLLSTPDLVLIHPEFEPHIKTTVDFILSKQSPDGSYLKNFLKPNEKELVDWCNGSTGVSWLMAKASTKWSENKYKESLAKSGEFVWKKGLTRRSPSISNGIAGNGYLFLMLHRLTSDPKYLHRAKQFAKFIFNQTFASEGESPLRPYSLYNGWAGVVCYLVDILTPESAQFPLFFDIFIEESVETSEDLATMSETLKDDISKSIIEA